MQYILAFLTAILSIILSSFLLPKYSIARIFSIIWGMQVVLIYLLFGHLLVFYGYGLLYISIMCMFFTFGEFIGKKSCLNYVSNLNFKYIFRERTSLFFLKILIFLSFLSVINGIYKTGFSVFEIVSLEGLLQLNDTASELRYSGVQTNSVVDSILRVFLYIPAAYGGFVYPFLSRKKRYMTWITLLPPLLITFTQNTKLGFITSVFFWLSGYWIAGYSYGMPFMKISIKSFLKILLGGFVFLFLLFISMILRTGRIDNEIIQVIERKFINYSVSHLSAFDIWYSTNNVVNYSFGIKTFYGISNAIGLVNREQGVFTDFVTCGNRYNNDIRTNVYSVFRFLIEDYATLGSILFIFLLGFIGGVSLCFIKKRILFNYSQMIALAVLYFVSVSFATSIFAYSSYIVTIFFMYLLMKYSFVKQTNMKI